MSQFSWQGASGRWYEFDVVRANPGWEPLGGLYMFVKPGEPPTNEAGGPVALFLAQTANFLESLARHEMWSAASQLGALEIHLLKVGDQATRLRIEQDLLEAQTPILNRQMLRRVA